MSTIRANSITNSAGSGAPDFPNGLTSGGVAVVPGTQTFTASGSIAAGDVVSINPNGTLSKISVDASGSVLGFGATYSSGFSATGISNYGTVSLSDTKFVSVYYNNSATTFSARVGTVASDGNATFGTAATTSVTATNGYMPGAVKVSSDSFAIVYSTGSTNWSVVIGQVSGDTVTFGSGYTILGVAAQNIRVASNGNGTIVVSNGANTSPYALRVVALTVSGTVVTVGANTTLRSATPAYYVIENAIDYDPVNNNFLLAVYDVNTNACFGTILTVSGTSVSASAFQSLGSETGYSPVNRIKYSTQIGRYIYRTKANLSDALLSTVSVSGTTITRSTFNSPSVAAGNFSNGTEGFFSHTGEYVFSLSTTNYTVTFAPTTFAPTLVPLTSGSTTAISGLLFSQPAAVGTSGFYATWFGGVYGFSTTSFYVGIATESVSDGQPVKVAVSGGIAGNLSGLSLRRRYYVDYAGALSTTSSERAYIGTATSATSLLLAPGTA